MCGIAVAIDWEDAEKTAERLVSGVNHRGDVTDPVVSPRPKTAMATRRLRIVDADHALQPQTSFDGKLIVSFNGEIYNHAELRQELSLLGVTFRTECDTEVLANALQVWGVKALQRLNGMFAFVAIDISSGEFLAARDPFGVKPLYVIQSETGYLFCSEIKPLLSASNSGEVLVLPPGHLLSRKYCARYKSAVQGPFDGRAQNDVLALDSLLAKSVQVRIPKDLPFATMLSGGIDSTLVAHYAQRLAPEAPCYFLGNNDAPDFQYASAYADKSGVDLRQILFDPDSNATFDLIDTVVGVSESFEPNVIRAALCSYLVSQKIHQDGYRVALCGEGADELFAGYPPLAYAFCEGNETANLVRNQFLELMHCSCLQRVDRSSMNFQLEVREPFLDPSIVNYCLNLDASTFVRDDTRSVMGKMPLRSLYNLYPDKLPSEIRDRSKVPFGEGAGLHPEKWSTRFMERIEEEISDCDFRDGKSEFEQFEILTKEELFYIRKLSRRLDVSRVPHLRGRSRINYPMKIEDRLLSDVKSWAISSPT